MDGSIDPRESHTYRPVTVEEAQAFARLVRKQPPEPRVRTPRRTAFDIWLVPSQGDLELAIGVRRLLEDRGLSVLMAALPGDTGASPEAAEVRRTVRDAARRCAWMCYLHRPGSSPPIWLDAAMQGFKTRAGTLRVRALSLAETPRDRSPLPPPFTPAQALDLDRLPSPVPPGDGALNLGDSLEMAAHVMLCGLLLL